jgi:flagellar basal-body rod protein FlgF
MKIVGFTNDRALKRGPNSLLIADEPPQKAPQAKVVQGAIEESNVIPMFEISRMSEVVRNFQQAANIIDKEHERQRDAVRRLGKPGGI